MIVVKEDKNPVANTTIYVSTFCRFIQSVVGGFDGTYQKGYTTRSMYNKVTKYSQFKFIFYVYNMLIAVIYKRK